MSKPIHIAVLDDNEDILQMTTTMLTLESYRVSPCNNLLALQSTLATDPPAVILLDMLLSGLDGRDVCRSIKEDTNTSHIPIIIFTAHPNAEESCKEAGADFFLEKPFELEHLYTKVQEASNTKI